MNEELKVVISAEIGELKKGVQEAQTEIDRFSKNGVSGFDQFNTAVGTMGEKSTALLKGVGTAVAGAGAALLALSETTKEYRTSQEKLNAAFESAGGSAEGAKTVYNDLYRVLGDGDVAVEAANHLAKLTTNEKELSEWTKICQGVYATFGDSLAIEGLTEAVNHTAKLGSVQGSLADALEWSGINVDEFNLQLAECSTEGERAALIQNTLSGLYDEAAEAYEQNAASLLEANEAQAKLDESMASIGETMEPIMTSLKELGGQILAELAPYLKDFAENNLPAIKEALSGVGEKIGEVIKWIADNWEIISTIGAIVLTIATAISVLSAGLTLYNTIMAITSAVSLPIVGIIAAIVAGIALLVAAIVLCVKHWDEIKAKVVEVWDKIKETVSGAIENVKTKFNDMKDNLSKKAEEIKTNMREKFEAIKTTIQEKIQAAKDIVVTVFEAIKNDIKIKIETAKNVIKNVLSLIKSIFTGDLGAAKTAALNIFDSIKTGIKQRIENARDFVKTAIEKIKGFFNFEWELPKIKLPHFSIEGKFSLDPPSIPKLSVEWYAQGGVFDSPTLFGYGNGMLGGLGEQGAEAIVPLEKNTQWLDKIAERLNSGSAKQIVLQVDGKTFAEASINSINQLTRQTGSLSLVLV